MLKLTCVVGARPNFIKMAALLHETGRRPGIEVQLVHTGQHYSPEMSGNFFRELEMPEPDCNLGVSSGTQTQQTTDIMKGIESVFAKRRPDILVVVGDVTSTLASALVAVKMAIPVAHVEAGLRSRDRAMPEEINRLLTDAMSDYLFVTEESGKANLLSEGVPEEKIHFVGNVMIDTLLRFRQKASASDVLRRLNVEHQRYAVATLHRPSNVDSMETLEPLLATLAQVAKRIPIVFPVHPRTEMKIREFTHVAGGLHLTPPLGYLDFLRLLTSARLVLTDSGGIQEETTILQVPCLTMRDNTERPVTITHGTNRLVQPYEVLEAVAACLASPMPQNRVPELWDGRAAQRIIDILEGIA